MFGYYIHIKNIANTWSKVISNVFKINEPIYWYWRLLQFLGTNIHWLTSLVEIDGRTSDR